LDTPGEWSEVRKELEVIVQERVSTLPALGITGADLVISTVGAGLRPFTKFARVELPNGEAMDPGAYLDEVQTLVIKSVLSELMSVDQSGVEIVDPVTQLYVLGRFQYGTDFVPFDELNTLVHGIMAGARGRGVEILGAHGLTNGARALLEKDGKNLQLRDFTERGGAETLGHSPDGLPAPVIDVLHRLLWLAQHRPLEIAEYLLALRPDARPLRLVAQALSGTVLSGKGVGTTPEEQDAARRLLAAWPHLVERHLSGVDR
jgi:putative DNA methylase